MSLATWYVNSNYGGSSISLTTGAPSIPDLSLYALQAKFSSGKMFNTLYEVTLYDTSSYNGARMSFRAPQFIPNLSDYGWNDKAVSVSCVVNNSPYCIAYRDANNLGKSVYFTAGSYGSLGSTQIGNDTISSLILGPGTRVLLFKDSSWLGTNYDTYENSGIVQLSIPQVAHNDWASSMIVEAY